MSDAPLDGITGIFATDGYKLAHRDQYPTGTEYVYSNWTARGSRVPGVDHVVFLGLQCAIQRRLVEDFAAFFAAPVDEVCAQYQGMLDSYLGPGSRVGTDHVRELHGLGYLPLEFRALPEGTRVPLRVPMFTVENTNPRFAWLVNYLETILSASLWMPSTSATNALRIRELLDGWAERTGAPAEGVPFQGHDFSMRGMAGLEAACLSGLGHLVAFTGTETVPALRFVRDYYPTDEFVAGTVPATEHSVMCAGGREDELQTYGRLLDLYPSGVLSVVSDTWDLWKVLTETLPTLHDRIVGRDGKLVIRPDSGDPVNIVCGTERVLGASDPAGAGVYELLWNEFGGTTNAAGYRVLNPHVGVIYGDSMNYERVDAICARLAEKGFSPESMVFGLGSFGYQYQTRDTFGFALKATHVVVNGEDRAIFKDPVTDDGLKRSLRGRIAVVRNGDGELVALDDDRFVWRDALRGTDADLLQPIWRNGEFLRRYGLHEVRTAARTCEP